MRSSVSFLISLVGLLVTAGAAAAFEDKTHLLINDAAADAAHVADGGLEQFLTSVVGLFRGLETPFDDGAPNGNSAIYTAREWLWLGSIAEDVPLCRTARHFHDPLELWPSSGLSTLAPSIGLACGGFSFPSSIVWGQDRGQQVGEQRSWFDAREDYWNALSLATEASRDRAWASALQTLGQLMHLVADASVPEHVRNDTHIFESALRRVGLRDHGSYEWWVEDNSNRLVHSGPSAFDRAILRQPTQSAQAPIAIARLIDTDTYKGLSTGAGVTLGGAIGIAEFANANFFSEDTGNRWPLERAYPFPAIDLLLESELPAPHGTNIRRYYKKGPDGGLPVDPILAECVFDDAARADGLPVPWTYNCVDHNVWHATAVEMLPRAVDYAAGVLEFFFRGRIEIAPPDRYTYGLAPYLPGNDGVFTKLRFKVRNATPGEDAGPGRLFAVVRYRVPLSGQNLIDTPTAEISDRLYYAVSDPLDGVTLTTNFQELVFNFTSMPLPANSADLFLTVAYRGRLGLEDNAVMVGGKDLFEPDPVDVGNATDWDCFNGELFSVTDPNVKRDRNDDGLQDLFGPSVAYNTFLKAFDTTGPVPVPSQQNFDFTIAEMAVPQYGRLIMLQDQPLYGAAVLSRSVHDLSNGLDSTNTSKVAEFLGVYNRVVVDPLSGLVSRRTLANSVYRGVPFQHALLLTTEEAIPCLPGTWSLGPNLIRIEGGLPPE